MGQGRLTTMKQNQLYAFIADLIYNRTSEVSNESGNISPTKVRALIQSELGMSLSKKGAYEILKRDLHKWKDRKPASNENIKEIVKQLNVLTAIIADKNNTSDEKIRAANSYSGLMKTKLAWEKQLAELEIKKAESTRPIYKVGFGHFKNVEVICPKCKNKFYDIPAKSKDNVENAAKQKVFKSDKVQKSFDELEGEKNE